jgi:outer membrane beta-barrel protein
VIRAGAPILALALTLLAALAPGRSIVASALTIGPSRASAQCIDEAIRDELNARRRYRGVRERLFQKAGRFELSVFGGIYAADLLSASYLVGGSLTYHVTEDIGLEASFGYSHAQSDLVHIIEATRGITLVRIDAPVYIYTAHLVWTLAYGKLRWFGADIGRFDFNFAIGGGITDNTTSRGLTGSFGFGVKFFFAEWFEIRIDVRDQILEQELLGSQTIVNNLTATLGLAAYIPFEN